MDLTSPDFENNTLIPSKFTCDGEDINPSLEIAGVPGDAESLVLIMDDPDAPEGTWTHWTVWNIDPDTRLIGSGVVPVGAIEGMTSFGSSGYGGPCPPSGTHRYLFKLYALNSVLDIGNKASVEELEEGMKGKTIAEAQLIGLYTHIGG
jgi:Raf kinase inhibitor-like YbhB/YbcL family protein